MRPNHTNAPLPPKPSLSRHGDRRLVRIEDLPPPGIKRWVIRRKAEVVAAVHAAGYRYVTLDLEGLRSGNLNGALSDPPS